MAHSWFDWIKNSVDGGSTTVECTDKKTTTLSGIVETE